RSENKDANEHIERVLEIVDLFTTPNVTQDQLMLRVLPITHTGAANRWLRNKPSCLITTWEIIKGKFLSKYCPPSRTTKKIEEINNFQQEPDETLYQAWERFNELLLRCPQHYLTCIHEVILFDKGLDVPTRQILDSKGGMPKMIATDAKNPYKKSAIQAQLNNLGREIKKVNKKVYVAQVGCELCNGPHYTKDCPLKEEGKTFKEAYYTQFGVPFPQAGRYRVAAPGFYQRDNENSSYQEKRQTMEESLNKFMTESVKRHNEHFSLIKEIQASMDVAIINQGASFKALEIQIGQMSKGLLKEKSRIEEEIKATIKVHCSTIIKDALPPKEKDPWIFTLPCSINNMCFDKALADLGASVSVMLYSTFTSIGLGKLAPTKLIIELADRTVKRPKGIAENVLVRIDNFFFPVDFIVLDMPEDIKIPLILGRPFLSNAHAKIDVFKRKFALRIENDKIDLDPEIEEGEIIDEQMVDVVKIRDDDEIAEKIDEYPTKELRPSLYDERVIGLGYTLMFLTHSYEALKIEKFKSARENKIAFAYDYGNVNENFDTFSSVRRPKHRNVILQKKGSSNASSDNLSSLRNLNLNKDVKRYSRKDLLSCNNSHHVNTKCAYECNDDMNVSCNSRLHASYDLNDLYVFDDVIIRNSLVSKISFRKKSRDSLNVFFLRSKDKALEVIISFIKKTQVNLQLQVQRVRTDNGTEFKNKTLAKFFDKVKVTQQFSAARTPQKNGVVERRNHTLVEAARTMLTFANYHYFFALKPSQQLVSYKIV
ncbi:pyruvate dehydrogenase (acetyl-transferring) kinase, mitochondrial, partial [Tanacetum coccineum]